MSRLDFDHVSNHLHRSEDLSTAHMFRNLIHQRVSRHHKPHRHIKRQRQERGAPRRTSVLGAENRQFKSVPIGCFPEFCNIGVRLSVGARLDVMSIKNDSGLMSVACVVRLTVE